MAITVGREQFRTKGKAEERCRAILDAFVGDDIPAGPDWDFVMALLEGHPTALEKIGAGVAGFRVVREPGKIGLAENRHFVVVRTDGSAIDFGYRKCLSCGSPRKDCLAAMWAAVADQQAAARAGVDGRGAELVVHHDGKTFNRLATQWLKGAGLTFETVAVGRPADGIGKVMTDAVQMEAWQTFHRERARLVVMDADAHRHLPRGPRGDHANAA